MESEHFTTSGYDHYSMCFIDFDLLHIICMKQYERSGPKISIRNKGIT